jgi:hypothetical protein
LSGDWFGDLSGYPVTVNSVVKNGSPVAWSGMTLAYVNSAANQDNGKNATVQITYTLSAFQENVVQWAPRLLRQ